MFEVATGCDPALELDLFFVVLYQERGNVIIVAWLHMGGIDKAILIASHLVRKLHLP